ncbi:hypothetical protein [Microbacterium sp.]|uniref:hypothetical protein n=1 Tax=Microbacterium sp. TaxID=51671 RepID=UPI0039E288F8
MPEVKAPPLPNIVLDAVGNNSVFGPNPPASFDKDPRLRPEGDFDRSFALHCPRGYRTDALYLFTPDIMARFVDHAAARDVEIVDDWLFLYAPREIVTLDPEMWAWLVATIAARVDEFAQWERWRDDRLVDGGGGPALGHVTDAGRAPDAGRAHHVRRDRPHGDPRPVRCLARCSAPSSADRACSSDANHGHTGPSARYATDDRRAHHLIRRKPRPRRPFSAICDG